jgi:hypothetical protein
MLDKNINRIQEIVPEFANTNKRMSGFAKGSFYMGISLVPSSIIACLVREYTTYDSTIEFLTTLLYLYVLLGSPLSVLSAIIAMIQISLNKNTYEGYHFALHGILLSLFSFFVTACYIINQLHKVA